MASSATDVSSESLSVLSNYPAMQPPAGVESNFSNPGDQNQPFMIVTSLLLGIMGVFFLNRLYTKKFIARKYSWDDLTVIFAVVGSTAYYVACVWGAQKGKLGVHFWDVSVAETSRLDLLIPCYLITVLTPATMMSIKVSFFFLYLQIFQPMRWLRICAYIGAVLTSSFYGGMTVAQFVFSTPRRGETWISHQTTWREHLSLQMSVPQSVVGLAIDLYILVLPIIAVSRLQVPTRRKIGVMLIFMTGLLACLSSLLSIYYRNILNHSKDLTWVLMPVNTVTLVEMFIGIICACTPAAVHSCRYNLPSYDTLKSLLLYHAHTLPSSFKRTNSSSSVGSKDNKLGKLQHEGTHRTHRPYSNIDGCQPPFHTDLALGQIDNCRIVRDGR